MVLVQGSGLIGLIGLIGLVGLIGLNRASGFLPETSQHPKGCP